MIRYEISQTNVAHDQLLTTDTFLDHLWSVSHQRIYKGSRLKDHEASTRWGKHRYFTSKITSEQYKRLHDKPPRRPAKAKPDSGSKYDAERCDREREIAKQNYMSEDDNDEDDESAAESSDEGAPNEDEARVEAEEASERRAASPPQKRRRTVMQSAPTTEQRGQLLPEVASRKLSSLVALFPALGQKSRQMSFDEFMRNEATWRYMDSSDLDYGLIRTAIEEINVNATTPLDLAAVKELAERMEFGLEKFELLHVKFPPPLSRDAFAANAAEIQQIRTEMDPEQLQLIIAVLEAAATKLDTNERRQRVALEPVSQEQKLALRDDGARRLLTALRLMPPREHWELPTAMPVQTLRNSMALLTDHHDPLTVHSPVAAAFKYALSQDEVDRIADFLDALVEHFEGQHFGAVATVATCLEKARDKSSLVQNVPINVSDESEKEIFKDARFIELLTRMHLLPPDDGETEKARCWKIPHDMTKAQMQTRITLLGFERPIVEQEARASITDQNDPTDDIDDPMNGQSAQAAILDEIKTRKNYPLDVDKIAKWLQDLPQDGYGMFFPWLKAMIRGSMDYKEKHQSDRCRIPPTEEWHKDALADQKFQAFLAMINFELTVGESEDSSVVVYTPHDMTVADLEVRFNLLETSEEYESSVQDQLFTQKGLAYAEECRNAFRKNGNFMVTFLMNKLGEHADNIDSASIDRKTDVPLERPAYERDERFKNLLRALGMRPPGKHKVWTIPFYMSSQRLRKRVDFLFVDLLHNGIMEQRRKIPKRFHGNIRWIGDQLQQSAASDKTDVLLKPKEKAAMEALRSEELKPLFHFIGLERPNDKGQFWSIPDDMKAEHRLEVSRLLLAPISNLTSSSSGSDEEEEHVIKPSGTSAAPKEGSSVDFNSNISNMQTLNISEQPAGDGPTSNYEF